MSQDLTILPQCHSSKFYHNAVPQDHNDDYWDIFGHMGWPNPSQILLSCMETWFHKRLISDYFGCKLLYQIVRNLGDISIRVKTQVTKLG